MIKSLLAHAVRSAGYKIFMALTLTAFITYFIYPHFSERNNHPVPTEVEEDEEKWKEFVEQMHRAAPGTDWEEMDAAHRSVAYDTWKKQAVRKKGASNFNTLGVTENIDNGALIGTWNEKGSNNLAGRIVCADLYASTNQIYAGSGGGNVWKGNIDGTGWTCLNDKKKFPSINMLRVIPNGSGKRILVATGDKNFYYSDDEGANWIASTGLSSIQSWGNVIRAVVLDDAARTIYLQAVEWDYGANWEATTSIYRSTDKGASFQQVRTFGNGLYGSSDFFCIWAPVKGNPSAYMASRDSIYTFNATTGKPTAVYKHNLGVSSKVLLTGYKNSSSTYLYFYSNKTVSRSTNGGASWTTMTMPNSDDPISYNSFSCSINNADYLYYGNIDAFRSTNGGASWTRVNNWYDYYNTGAAATTLHADIQCVSSVINSSNQEIQLIGNDGGLYTSTNYLANVTNIGLSGLNVSQYYSTFTNRNDVNYIYAGSQDQGFQRAQQDPGGVLSFTQIISGDYGHLVSQDNGNSLWIVYPGFTQYYADAKNGTSSAEYDFPSGAAGLWLPPVMEDPNSATKVYLAGGNLSGSGTHLIQLQYTAGSGISATELPYDFGASSGGGKISAMGYSKANTNYRYVATDNGYFFYSTNAGSSWTITSSFNGPASHYFYGSTIYASKLNSGTVYVGGSGYSNPGVYKSTNNGQTFTAVNTGLPNTLVFGLAANDDESQIYAATEVGPYVYIVSENKWYSMSGTGAPDQTYWSVEYISSTKTVRFGTYGRGIWDFKIQNSNVAPTVSITAPSNGANYNAPASVTITANASDSDGSISKVEFYNGTTLVGTATASPYTVTWSNVAAGTYSLTAKAYDNANATTTSSAVSITVNGSNQAPTVSITSPTNGATYTAPASISITANASDADGTISKVEFYNGTTLLGTVTGSPYAYTWTNVAAGNYSITAKAYDNANASTTSTAVSITLTTSGGCTQPQYAAGTAYYDGTDGTHTASQVQNTGHKYQCKIAGWCSSSSAYYYAPGTGTAWQDAWTDLGVCSGTNQAPTVSLTAPTSGASFTAPANITVSANASDSDGSITKVEFYNGSTLIGTATASPYTITWSNVAAGSYSLTAKAYDNASATTTSSAVSITVNAANNPPTVSLTAPANGASYTAPATVTVSATATDTDGSISKVEFYNGSTLIGTATASPFTITWSNVGAGSYSITAKAYDNASASTTSSARSITVTGANNPPTVSLTAPTNGATFTAPASITLSANASDSDGSITKVEFYRGGTTLIGTATASPYTITWSSVAAGSYSITAKAYDNASATTTSSAASITVNSANQAPTVSLTAPSNGATFTAPASIAITASASDADGSISKVEFYNGSTLLATVTASPYSYTWSSVAAGTYSITAKAYDNLSATATSGAVSVTVNSSSGCSAPQYVENGGYVAGSRVKNAGNQYECKPYPYTSWCNGAAWAYAPGTGTYWTDAWTLIGTCAKIGSIQSSPLIVYPNPNDGSFSLNIENGGPEYNVIVTNSVGEEIYKYAVSAGSLNETINLTNHPQGLYYIRITSEDQSWNTSIMKK